MGDYMSAILNKPAGNYAAPIAATISYTPVKATVVAGHLTTVDLTMVLLSMMA